jgi:hypothetical protein
MPQIYIPARSAEDWRPLLASPETQWVPGYSAHALAYTWQKATGWPSEVKAALETVPELRGAEILIALPEHQVPLPPRGRAASQSDLWVLAAAADQRVSITVEGKVEESFDKTVAELLEDASDGKKTRWEYLLRMLELQEVPPGTRYQLMHRTVSALVEAQRFGANAALMLVHSFSKSNAWFDDFRAFASLFGAKADVGKVVPAGRPQGINLYLGWAHGVSPR